MNSKQKGKRGELELAHEFEKYGYDARRGQQFCGLEGNADVVGLPGLHIECKRDERTQSMALIMAMNQSVKDARNGEIPIVAHRKNRGRWMVTLELDAFMGVYMLAGDYSMARGMKVDELLARALTVARETYRSGE